MIAINKFEKYSGRKAYQTEELQFPSFFICLALEVGMNHILFLLNKEGAEKKFKRNELLFLWQYLVSDHFLLAIYGIISLLIGKDW